MKAVIVREVRTLVFRLPASTAAQATPSAPAVHTHIRFTDDDPSESKPKAKEKFSDKDARWNSHAWYYAAVTLNQVVLTPSSGDRLVARMLVDMYFEMFEEVLSSNIDDDAGSDKEEKASGKEKRAKGKGQADGNIKVAKRNRAKEFKGEAGFVEVEDSSSRLIGAILTGVNRALPFAQMHFSSESSAVYVDIQAFTCLHFSNVRVQLPKAHRHPFPRHSYLHLQYFPSSPNTDPANLYHALHSCSIFLKSVDVCCPVIRRIVNVH